jgi:hypothetical protein
MKNYKSIGMPLSRKKMQKIKGGTVAGCRAKCLSTPEQIQYSVPLDGCGDYTGIGPCYPGDTLVSCSCQKR